MTQHTRDKLELAIQFVKVVGVPSAVLGVVLWWIGAATDRLHDSVLVPTVTAHSAFLRSTMETQERQATALEQLTDNRVQQTQILEEIAAGQQQILSRLGHPIRQGAAE